MLGVLSMLLLATHAGTRAPSIEFLGSATIAGLERDHSGLTERLAGEVSSDRFGSFGSAIAYTGRGNRYIALNDRGPLDGALKYPTRLHELEIAIEPASAEPVMVRVLKTTMLTDERGGMLEGFVGAFDPARPREAMRYDPEGVRVGSGRDGEPALFICEEYGPRIDEFGLDGRRVRSLTVPEKFGIEKPSALAIEELPPHNEKGRQANRGFEGLAISADGARLYALPQSPLIQDGGLDKNNSRVGVNVRMLEVDVKTGATREFLYLLDSASNGLNELLAINDHEFLAIERDGELGTRALYKRIVRIDIDGATDISGIERMGRIGMPPDVEPVRKSEFLDLLDPRWGLGGAAFPEKIEGLCFGPDLADGRRMLIVTSDNDLRSDVPTMVWVFAVSREVLE